jgi:hypothetical protein
MRLQEAKEQAYADDYDKALWYAWGREDGGEKLRREANSFASQYARRYSSYRDEKVSWVPSMRAAFASWNETGRIV